VRFRHEAAVWHVVRTERKSNLILLRASFDLVRSTRLSELPALPSLVTGYLSSVCARRSWARI
jgi:hypothetical protein